MAPSPLRQLLEGRVSQLLADADRTADDWRRRAVRDCADRLNQAVRRMRQAENLTALTAALVDSAALFAAGAALFQIDSAKARLECLRGLPGREAPAGFEIPLALAPAIGGAIETRDPVVAAGVPGQISSALVELMGHSPDVCVSILPIVLDGRVPAVLYAWGGAESSALELLAQVAAASWSSLAPPAADKTPLVTIAPSKASETTDAAPAAKSPQSWDDLSPEKQAIHLGAQRYARVKVAQMRISETEAVRSGRTHRDLYDTLRDPIDAARLEFREKFFAACPGMLDYLHLEIVRTLANEDAELLGPAYPGPMV